MPRTLAIRPIQADLTHDVDWLSKMDPYIEFSVGIHKKKSSICNSGGKHPKWHDVITFEIKDEDMVYIHVWDHETFEKDKLVGEGQYSLLEALISGKAAPCIELFYHEKPAGKLFMEILVEAFHVSHESFVKPTSAEFIVIEEKSEHHNPKLDFL